LAPRIPDVPLSFLCRPSSLFSMPSRSELRPLH
jgi:hypothetical protein